MEFLKRINYLKRFTSLFILTGISFALLIFFVLYIELSHYQESLEQEKAYHEFMLKQEEIKKFYKDAEKFLSTIEKNRFFTSFLETPNQTTQSNLSTFFEALVEHDASITQLRYLDEMGNEVMRVDRDTLGGSVYLVPQNKLQNKANRGYFLETMQQKPHSLYISHLDLNIEHGAIEIPYKPVLRFAIPIVDQGKKRGILIVNIFGQHLLDNLIASGTFFIDIFDHDGDVLVSNVHAKKQWTKYLKSKPSLELKKMILQETLISIAGKDTLYIGFTPKNTLASFFKIVNGTFIGLILFVIVASFVLAYYLAKIPKKLFDELELQQNMLIQQSKLSAMGEMINMLAHQWRQPLNAVSVLLQEIEIKKSMKILSDEDFDSISQNIHKILLHMSKTIDDFRDFFKPSKMKNTFNVQEAIEASADILKMQFEKYKIEFTTIQQNDKSPECFLYRGYESEFKQVIINLINNAIEALHENVSDEKRFIKIYLNGTANDITIEVQDNAGGIDSSVLKTLFEPYSSTKLEKNGSGLGLYMSKLIVEKNMDGIITAKNKDNGALFTIVLHK